MKEERKKSKEAIEQIEEEVAQKSQKCKELNSVLTRRQSELQELEKQIIINKELIQKQKEENTLLKDEIKELNLKKEETNK